jgi:hypothetical protein
VVYLADGICMAYLDAYKLYKREEALRANILWMRHAVLPELNWTFADDKWQGLYVDGKAVY